MFDSDNVSLVTRLEAGDGVLVTYNQNSVGEDVWKASVDETWLATQIGSQLTTLNAEYIARIAATEAALGITTAGSGGGGSSTPTGQMVVNAPGGSGTIPTSLSLTWNVVGIDMTNLVTKKVTLNLPSGASTSHVASALVSSINGSTGALKFLNALTISGNTIYYSWKDAGEGFSITVTPSTSAVTVTVS